MESSLYLRKIGSIAQIHTESTPMPLDLNTSRSVYMVRTVHMLVYLHSIPGRDMNISLVRNMQIGFGSAQPPYLMGAGVKVAGV
jgi:hypothetical protein